jgi:hypothetical protein
MGTVATARVASPTRVVHGNCEYERVPYMRRVTVLLVLLIINTSAGGTGGNRLP